MRLSLCMIVKNEEEMVANCLSSVKGLVDEIIILDTGSTDATVRIAETFGATVIPFQWTNDFSAARNESIRHATGDWILVLDADEVLDAAAKEKIHHAIADEQADKEGTLGYRTPVCNYVLLQDGEMKSGVVPVRPSAWTKNANAYFQSTTIRLFRNTKNSSNKIFYVGKIHELLNIDKEMTLVKPSSILIHHYGYLRDPAHLEKKKQHYLQLGIEKAAKEKTPESYVELGSLYFDFGEREKAREYLEKAIALKPTVPEWHLTLAIIHKRRHDYSRAEQALRQALFIDQKKAVIYINPNPYPFIFASLGEIFYRKKQYQDAAFLFEKALKGGHPNQQIIQGALRQCHEKIKQ